MSEPPNAAAQRSIKDALQSLAKLRSTTRLYGQGHRFTQRFAEHFCQSILGALEQGGAFRLKLTASTFELGDAVISKGDTMAEMAFILYGEGLRFLGFQAGVPSRELSQLAELLIMPWDRRASSEQDMLSMLWRADLRFVDLVVVERFAEVLGERGEAALREDLAIGKKKGAQRGSLTGDSVLVEDLDLQALMEETEQVARQFRMKQDEAALYLKFRKQIDFLPDPRLQAQAKLFEISAAERRALQADVELVCDELDVDIDQAAWILFELVRSGREGKGQDTLGMLAASTAVSLIEQARPHDAATFMRRCLSFKDQDFPGVLAEKNFLLGYGTLLTTQRTRLGAALSALGDAQATAPLLFTLLGLIHKDHLDLLPALIPELRHLVHQLVVVDTLRLHGRLDLDSLAQELASAQGSAAILPLLALWREGAGRGRQQAWRLIGDEDARLREASLRCLRGESSERMRAQVLSAMADTEPSVRVEALRHAALLRGGALMDSLERGAKPEQLRRVEVDEMRAWCTAYAIAGKSGAQVDLGHRLLEESIDTEVELNLRAAAALALRASRAPQAGPAIDKALRRWPELTPLLEDSR